MPATRRIILQHSPLHVHKRTHRKHCSQQTRIHNSLTPPSIDESLYELSDSYDPVTHPELATQLRIIIFHSIASEEILPSQISESTKNILHFSISKSLRSSHISISKMAPPTSSNTVIPEDWEPWFT